MPLGKCRDFSLVSGAKPICFFFFLIQDGVASSGQWKDAAWSDQRNEKDTFLAQGAALKGSYLKECKWVQSIGKGDKKVVKALTKQGSNKEARPGFESLSAVKTQGWL